MAELAGLLDGLREGDRDALARVADLFGRDIFVAALAVLDNRADAEEVTMDTLAIAWRRAGELREPRALRRWLITVAVNRSYSLRRRLARSLRLRAPRVEAIVPDHAPSVVARIDLLEALALVPARTRAVLVLRYFGDLSVEETAAALGRSPNTVKTQTREGLARLRQAMQEADAVARPPKGRRHG